MELEDDIYDSSSSDVECKFVYNHDDTAAISIDGDFDYDDNSLQQKQNYTILSEADIRRRQDEDITELCDVLSISRASSSILICHYNWSLSQVHDAWFADEAKVREAVGLLEKPVVEIPVNLKELRCEICFESQPREKMIAVVCGHHFCGGCWGGYISTSINDGPGCLMLRCPEPSCGAVVDQDLINQLELVSNEDKVKYSRYLLRSYIEGNKNIKWCPAPECGYAVEFEVDRSSGGSCYDVTCHCSYSFCWNCTEETHRPVDCETVAKWILKNSAESENTNWILTYTKPCPKCKKPIEKNHGCMHMTCSIPCKFEFCWLCLGAWSRHHWDQTCNSYAAQKQEGRQGTYDEDETRRKKARIFLEKYTHYYERWASNQLSRQKALADLHQMQTTQLINLGVKQAETESSLEFITKAWLQIVECRRVLKWTYAYGYFFPDDEHAKKQFFEYLQGQAESGLERLHYCAEKELQVYLKAKEPAPGFTEFRTKLVGLTDVTHNYFENLVQALENGLSDVDVHGTCSRKSLGADEDGQGKKKTVFHR